MKKLKREDRVPTLHGHQVWQSSYMIMDYLQEHPLPPGQRIMDIGCGWGLIGIYCAKHFAGRALLVDADSRVFPYVSSHEQLNNVSVETAHASFDQLGDDDFRRQDIVLGADICFWPELLTQLKLLVTTALRAGVKQIIFADPGRPTFMQLADYCKRNFSCILCPRELGGRTRSKGYLLVIDNSLHRPRIEGVNT
ncbi:class I SAM-dependent methyltransferase [Exilibacterium tricleocarpae]|uniref:class I SAM-dependent methyltransferase n=1 Tax=Exilibacterium tricleocarpae TaxID=2591008 RepID=UPI0015D1F9FF|nr:methyltransferase [Exilibacterium tricleocarpae]